MVCTSETKMQKLKYAWEKLIFTHEVMSRDYNSLLQQHLKQLAQHNIVMMSNNAVLSSLGLVNIVASCLTSVSVMTSIIKR